MTDTPAVRALALLTLLQRRDARDSAQLAASLGVSARTLRRDVERLRRLGYAVETRPGPGAGYRLAAGNTPPPLLFEPHEITALVAGLRLVAARLPDDDAATRALAKLERTLSPRLRRRAAAIDLATEVMDVGDAMTSADVGVVADAIADDGRIRFAYTDQHGTPSARTVDPFRHVLRNGHWYLVGWDLDREDWRTYRFDRVADVERVPGVYGRREFPSDSVERWFATDFGRL